MLQDWTQLYHMNVDTSYNYLISYLEELLNLYTQYKVNVVRPTKKKLVP